MIPEWSNVKNQVNPKHVVDSNIPNDKSFSHSLRSLVIADALASKASQFQTQGQFSQAYHSYKKAFGLYQSSSDYYGQIQSAQKAGDMARQIEDFSSALRWYQASEKLIHGWRVEDYRKHQYRTDALCGMAMSYRGQGKLLKSIRLFEKTYREYKKNRDMSGMAYVLWAQGTTYRFRGELKKAEKALRASIALYLKLKDLSGLSYAQAGLGGTLRMKGLASESQVLYEKANRFFILAGDQFGQAYTFCGQGNALRMQGKLTPAKKLMDKAIRIYTRLNQKGPRGFVLWSRAQLHILSNNLSAAFSEIKLASRLFRQVHDRRGLVYCELAWGEYFRRKNLRVSQQHYNRVLRMTKTMELKLEHAHAQSRLSRSPDKMRFYRSLGVDVPHFSTYISLP